MAPEENTEIPASSRNDAPIVPEPTISVVPGQVIGERYRVDAPLGSGGMGVVCRATHLGLETPVAIKLIRPDFNADSEFVRRFLNEARRAAVLRSERIARVHDVGQLESGEPFLVMELLEGVELGKYLSERGPLPIPDAVNLVLQICEGLAEAHAAGIVHRDIKPGNTFLVRRTDGRFAVKILDFGISKQITETPNTLTGTNQSLGSPWYMSPEQMLDASSVDRRSDIWSVGVVLFELLTCTRPFDGTAVPEVCAKVLTAPYPSLASLRSDIPAELEAIVDRCLAKNPDDRYPDVGALGADLQAFAAHGKSENVEPTAFFEGDPALQEGSIAPVATAPISISRRRPPRSRFAHVLAAVGLAATGAIAWLAFGPQTVKAAREVAAKVHDKVAQGAATAATTTPASPVPATEPVTAPATTAAQPGPAGTESVAPPASSTSAAPPPDVTPMPSPAPSAADSSSAAAPPAAAPTTEPEPPAPAARPRRAPTRVQSSTREDSFDFPERGTTSDEIEARKERYVRWLAEQGLRRIDEADDNPYQ
jgi:serine/threonine-protein kinase